MAEVSWPYANDAVTEAEWTAMARLWRRSGVVDGATNELAVTAVTGVLQVSVASGQAWLDGFYYSSTSAVTLSLATADLSNPRVDLVVVRSDRNTSQAQLAVKTGTAAVVPAVPVVEQDHDGSGIFEIALAKVSVAAAAGNVDGEVVDARTFSLVPQDASFVTVPADIRALADDIEAANWGASHFGGFLAGVMDPGMVPYDSGEQQGLPRPPRFALIVAPQSLESTSQFWSGAARPAGTKTWWDGLRASQVLIDDGNSIGTWLSNLRTSDPVPADAGSDWYIPSLGELSLIYQNLKPDTADNYTVAQTVRAFPADGNGPNWGIYGGQTYYNPTSEPALLGLGKTGGYSASNPAQTSAAAFQLGAAEALDYDTDSNYLSSTEAQNGSARIVAFRGSVAGSQGQIPADVAAFRARVVRRVLL